MKRIEKTKELGQQYIKRINRELYKRNVELAIKNKTFSLLRKLYDITISSVVSLEDLAFRLAATIRQDLNFEAVGIYLLKEDNKELEVLTLVKSERLAKALEKEKISFVFDTIKLKNGKENICTLAARERKEKIATGLIELWPDKKFSQSFSDIQKKLPVKTIVVYPLVIDKKILGTLIIVLNRDYDSLSTFEKETIKSFISIIAVALDKTMAYEQLKKMNERLEGLMAELSKANIELKQLNKSKSEFLSIVSHQLRTPLSIIKGYISMLLEESYGNLPEKAKIPVENVFKSNERLIKLVNDLLNISRIEAGKLEMEFEKASPEELVDSVIGELKIEAEKKKLYLRSIKPEQKSPLILIDKQKIWQAILNVVDNAIRYTKRGGITIKIQSPKPRSRTFGSLRGRSKIQIIISDTGEGMTPKEISNLFISFSRGKAGDRLWVEGLGIGLYIAKKFVEMHNGKIWAESGGKGKGSTFYIELPAK